MAVISSLRIEAATNIFSKSPYESKKLEKYKVYKKFFFVVNEIYLLVFQLDLTTMNGWDPSEFSAATYSFVFVM